MERYQYKFEYSLIKIARNDYPLFPVHQSLQCERIKRLGSFQSPKTFKLWIGAGNRTYIFVYVEKLLSCIENFSINWFRGPNKPLGMPFCFELLSFYMRTISETYWSDGVLIILYLNRNSLHLLRCLILFRFLTFISVHWNLRAWYSWLPSKRLRDSAYQSALWYCGYYFQKGRIKIIKIKIFVIERYYIVTRALHRRIKLKLQLQLKLKKLSTK